MTAVTSGQPPSVRQPARLSRVHGRSVIAIGRPSPSPPPCRPAARCRRSGCRERCRRRPGSAGGRTRPANASSIQGAGRRLRSKVSLPSTYQRITPGLPLGGVGVEAARGPPATGAPWTAWDRCPCRRTRASGAPCPPRGPGVAGADRLHDVELAVAAAGRAHPERRPQALGRAGAPAAAWPASRSGPGARTPCPRCSASPRCRARPFGKAGVVVAADHRRLLPDGPQGEHAAGRPRRSPGGSSGRPAPCCRRRRWSGPPGSTWCGPGRCR